MEDDADLMSSIQLFDQMEIYPGSKLKHFRSLQQKTGIPYEEMLFFDDESRNREVAALGVTFILASDGLTKDLFENGVKEWRRKSKAQGVPAQH